MVYPLILNFAVSGELELNGFADSSRLKPKGALTFENGDVNLVATQVLLSTNPLGYQIPWVIIRMMQFMTQVGNHKVFTHAPRACYSSSAYGNW